MTNGSDPIRFLHLSDLHYRLDGGQSMRHLGVTWDPAQLFTEFISDFDFESLDFVAITGDLLNDGDANDYSSLRALLDTHVPIPYFVVLGNHDAKGSFREGFLGEEPDEAPYCYVKDWDGLRLIFLDTSLNTQSAGYFDPSVAEWFADVVTTPAPRGSVLFYHHPFEISWLSNEPTFSAPPAFVDALRGSDVRASFCGHLHMNRAAMVYGRLQYTTSAIAVGVHRSGAEVYHSNQLGYALVEVTDDVVDVCHQVFFPAHQVLRQ